MSAAEDLAAEPVAIVGMACRVPGSDTPSGFWHNMRTGTESITWFTRDELLAAGADKSTVDDPDHVPATGYLPDADRFDAEFFGFTPAEAQTMDPQQRILCETAWAAMEDAGHDAARFDGDVAVFAGTFMTKYLLTNLSTNARFQRSPMAPLARMFNDKDFLATRVSYLLNLTGPAYTVQTACSTSLVATHLACQSLLSYECDAAIVGGVTVNLPLRSGYPVADSGLFAADGHCRPFDASAGGTVPGNGAVVVVLRRLSEALADRDHVYAVIRGSAVNNDGAVKAGFAAPSVDGQHRVITSALTVADVDPATIGYVEAHGTATRVGDPIEVTALTQAYGGAPGSVALGSVKANIGHLDAAAGLAGLARAALSLHHNEIPPNANFTAPNPDLQLERTPFYVPESARPFPAADHPRRAAVSSFGVGGTNAHAVLEQAPERVPAGTARPWQLLPVSARTRTAVETATTRLADELDGQSPPALPDVAFTLQDGRRAFGVRRFAVVADTADAVAALRDGGRRRLPTRAAPETPHGVVFTFPGGGTQHPDMGLDVYRAEPVFRAEVDRCAELLAPRLGFDLRRLLFPSAFTPLPGREVAGGAATMGRDQGAGVVSSLFVIEYALARQLMAWGIRPAAMLGHSLGEYVAACVAGVFSLEDALEITLARGELFEAMDRGRMLVVGLPEDEVRAELTDRVSVSAVNAPDLTVVAGPDEDIAALLKSLRGRGVDCRKISVPVASHSWMVEPQLPEFRRRVAALTPSAPTMPVVSSVTGTWLTAAEATDPEYWARHLRQPVRFADGLRQVLAEPARVLLEVGPGRSLTALAAAQRLAPTPVAVPTMALPRDQLPDLAHLVTAVGRLWQAGADIDWTAFHGEARPHRVPLPTYPFQRRRHWVPAGNVTVTEVEEAGLDELDPVDLTDGFVAPRSDRERKIAAIWCDLLGLERVSVDDDFFDLGAHSLMVTQVTRELRRMGATELSARDVFTAGTVAGMAARVEAALGGAPPPPVARVDLAAEVVLDETITADGLDPAADPATPGTILLTGATGFVGAFLCAGLLERTSATVLCLTRATDPTEGLDRIRANLDTYGLRSNWGGRLRVLTGDLARPRFGLSEADFAALAEQVDTIHHCGAWVNFVRPYRVLKAANVLGTQEVLRLATTSRLKPVHYVSTLAVLAAAMGGDVPHLAETDPLPPPVGHDTDYSQSKWVAEGLLGLARERGVPVSIYRAGGVLADHRTGAANRDDYVTKVLQGCVQLGLGPLREYELAVGTVDHFAGTVVSLSLRQEALGRTFHPIDLEPLRWNAIFERLREFGYPVRSVPFGEWRAALVERVDQEGDDNALAPLMAMIGETPDRAMPTIGCAEVVDVLGGTEAPALDRAYFDRMLRFLVRGRMLPPVHEAERTGGSR